MTPRHYKTRLVRNGPWVAVRVAFEPPRDPETGEALDRSYMWSIEIDGELARSPSPDPAIAGVHVVEAMVAIDEAEFRYLSATSRHAKTNDPRYPEARPREPIDIRRLPAIF